MNCVCVALSDSLRVKGVGASHGADPRITNRNAVPSVNRHDLLSWVCATISVAGSLIFHQGSLKFVWNGASSNDDSSAADLLGGDDVNPQIGAFASVSVVRYVSLRCSCDSVYFHITRLPVRLVILLSRQRRP
jgi:hypothetical protein